MRCRVPVLLCALLVTALVVGATPAAAQPATTEETRLEVQLQDDGDARWTVVAVVPLEDEEDIEEFQSFANAFESGERDFDLGVETFRRAAEETSAATGREMRIPQDSTDRNAVIVNETEDGEVISQRGEFRLSFTWTSFARQDTSGTLYLQDSFNTTNGTWLPGLSDGQTLVLKSPPGYGGPSTSPIAPRAGELRWDGPQTFEPGYFDIVYEPGNGGPGGTDTETPVGPGGIQLSTLLLFGAVVLSAAALLLGLYLLWQRRDGETDGGVEATPSATDGPSATTTTESDETAGVGTSTDDETATDEGDEPEPPTDPELLSDEERVEQLLERNGGRMKQANIVKETGWSNAKVSQLLSSMDEAGRIEKLRIGRENLISFPDEQLGEFDDDEA
ncbi:hypothetical protein GJ631_03455 [Natronomonas sp. CBA1123]|uniref:helix-turn-helix transcriptional regulator n=1 Tax=Natronomonas sp. CBA1123 TaxID=2668070 RepID=UPI0012EB03E2|nr:hypothetical protein [Natronomonas sp. CBA1123]MUV85657.1 hypothetical protein [Natronomonas sp. CBA1123]